MAYPQFEGAGQVRLVEITGFGHGIQDWQALAEHFSEYREVHAGESVDVLVQRFVMQHGKRHNPAVLDALVGLSVAGKLEEIG